MYLIHSVRNRSLTYMPAAPQTQAKTPASKNKTLQYALEIYIYEYIINFLPTVFQVTKSPHQSQLPNQQSSAGDLSSDTAGAILFQAVYISKRYKGSDETAYFFFFM